MNYPFPCCHPLNVSWAYNTLMTFEVLMSKLSTEHIAYRFEPSMRMVRESCWKLHIEVIEHQERVKPP